MKLFDRIILTIYTFCLTLVSFVVILFPFEGINFLSVDSLSHYLYRVKGNYWFSIVGLAFLLVSIKFLISGITRNNKNTYIVRNTNYGELRISTQTIEGLAESVVQSIEGIKDIKTNVITRDNRLIIVINGLVSPSLNIPEVVFETQKNVKEHVENCTGIEVIEVKFEVDNIARQMKVS